MLNKRLNSSLGSGGEDLMCIVEIVTGLIKMHKHLKLGYIKTVSTEIPPPFCTSYLLYFLCLGISLIFHT